MLCLTDIIRDHEPSLQPLLRAIAETPTLTAMLVAAWPLARVLALQVVAAVLKERAGRPTSWPPCPVCGARLESKGFVERQVTSLFGRLRWRRRVGRCPRGCSLPAIAPLDAALGLAPYQRSSGELQALGCALAVFVPFATAATLLGWYSGRRVSPGAVWEWVQAAGQRAMAVLQGQLDALAAGEMPLVEPLDAAQAAMPLVIGADGVMVPLRPVAGTPKGQTSWREVKVGILARLGQQRTRAGQVVPRLYQRRLVAVLGTIEALKPRLWLAAVRQGITRAPRVVWLSDGARGLWGVFEEYFIAYATGVLDFYHAAQHLWKGAAAWLDGRTTAARRWFEAARHRLRHGPPAEVLAELAAAVEGEGLPATARATLLKVSAYLDQHRDHLDYAAYKALGLPLGSGMVESACKWLIQQRFKGVGMRWSETGFNHLLPLRLAWVNGAFETLFQIRLQPSPNT